MSLALGTGVVTSAGPPETDAGRLDQRGAAAAAGSANAAGLARAVGRFGDLAAPDQPVSQLRQLPVPAHVGPALVDDGVHNRHVAVLALLLQLRERASRDWACVRSVQVHAP